MPGPHPTQPAGAPNCPLVCVQLEKRKDKREKATKDLAEATAAEDAEQVEKFSKRLVKVTKQHNEDVRSLLTLMGIPWVVVSRNAARR